MMRTNESGRSMIEMLGVLAIVGVLSVGGIAGYSKAMAKFKTNKMIDQVNMISTNIRTMYSSQRSYNGLNSKLAAQVGIVPSEMFDGASNVASGTTSNGGLTNAFGGSVVVAAATTNTTEDSYIMAFDKVPAAACVNIITTDWGNDSGTGLVAIAVNSSFSGLVTAISGATTSAATNNVYGINGANFPVSLANATASCGTTGEVAIGWKYL